MLLLLLLLTAPLPHRVSCAGNMSGREGGVGQGEVGGGVERLRQPLPHCHLPSPSSYVTSISPLPQHPFLSQQRFPNWWVATPQLV